jgi:anti-anti-sigma factor
MSRSFSGQPDAREAIACTGIRVNDAVRHKARNDHLLQFTFANSHSVDYSLLHFMAVEKWSDSIVLAHLGSDPHFSEEIDTVMSMVPPSSSVVLDFSAVHFVNSSNIAELLRLRHRVGERGGKLILCNIGKTIWSTFLITGLDKIFDIGDDVPTALAAIQIK